MTTWTKRLQMKDENIPLIEYSALFNKQRKAAPLEIKIAFREALELFLDDTNHPNLRNHALREKYAGFRSINVTEDWRALFKIRKTKFKIVVTFHVLGTHAQLYK